MLDRSWLVLHGAVSLCAAAITLLGGAARAQDHGTATPAAAERTNARPFLWRIDGEVPSYLFGTFHLPDPRVTDLAPEVEHALDESDALFTELAMDQALTPAMTQAIRLPDGKKLGDVAPPELVARVCKRLGIAEGGASPALAMRPWALSMQVVLRPKPGAGEPLDLMIYKEARSAGKVVGGLETVAEQLAVFEDLGSDGELALLASMLDVLDRYEQRGQDLCEEWTRAYCEGDAVRVKACFDEMNGDREPWRRLNHTLLIDRNLRMAERIDRKLQTERGRRFTFAVGVGHLVGRSNIVELLRARGYKVARVPECAANLDEELEQLRQEVGERQRRIQELEQRRRELEAAPRKKAG